MIFQSAQFSLHAFYMLNNRPHDVLHFTINNTDTFGIIVCLALATFAAHKQRRAAARQAERAT